jgi:hypothetical protein
VNKEATFLGVMCCSKFTEEEHDLLLEKFLFLAVEFMRSQQIEFLSNLC